MHGDGRGMSVGEAVEEHYFSPTNDSPAAGSRANGSPAAGGTLQPLRYRLEGAFRSNTIRRHASLHAARGRRSSLRKAQGPTKRVALFGRDKCGNAGSSWDKCGKRGTATGRLRVAGPLLTFIESHKSNTPSSPISRYRAPLLHSGV